MISMNEMFSLFYLIVFLFLGFVFGKTMLPRNAIFSSYIGLLFGFSMAIVLPCLFAFVFGFTLLSHILALLLWLSICAFLLKHKKRTLQSLFQMPTVSFSWHLLFPFVIALILCALILHGYREADGLIYSSQATYGDMCLHIGIMNSVSTQQVFPPIYPFYPFVSLSYPFLGDTISSSMQVLGAHRHFAYVVPMCMAACFMVWGVWLFYTTIWQERGKAFFASVFLFLNGGFGLLYFLDSSEHFFQMFTAYHETPTNLWTHQVHWANLLVDLFLPQRTFLFGWMLLFGILNLMEYTKKNPSKEASVTMGILWGILPMVHTHTFIAISIVIATTMYLEYKEIRKESYKGERILCALLACIVYGSQFLVDRILPRDSQLFFYLVIVVASLVILRILYTCICIIREKVFSYFFSKWGIVFVLGVGLALPQLWFWTFSFVFSDVTTVFSIHGWYNWFNNTGSYLMYYIINMGVFALLVVPSILFSKKERFVFVFPSILIWFMVEFVQFQPNAYDNNKFLYIAYALLLVVVTDYVVDFLRKRKKAIQIIGMSVCLFLASISAILTIIREFRSEYVLFGKDAIQFANYIDRNTEPDAIFLTGRRHNNEVITLAGRNVAYGTSAYVYFHGIQDNVMEKEIKDFYQNPKENEGIFEKYGIDYFVVSDHEKNEFEVNMEEIQTHYSLKYQCNGFQLYEIKK